MASLQTLDQRALCSQAIVVAKVTAANPVFTLYGGNMEISGERNDDGGIVGGKSGAKFADYDEDLNNELEFQIFPTIFKPATTFQLTAENAIIKSCNFATQALSDFSRRQLFHAIVLSYIGDPDLKVTIDDVEKTMTNEITDAGGLQNTETLYFQAMTIGFIPRIEWKNNDALSVKNRIVSVRYISEPVDE